MNGWNARKLDEAYELCIISEDYYRAVLNREDRWVPACGGTEQVDHRGILYVYNPFTRRHGWLGSDDIVADSYAQATPRRD